MKNHNKALMTKIGVRAQLTNKHHPALYKDLDHDFIKLLKMAFKLRYASAESPGFGILINQYRTFLQIYIAFSVINQGFSITLNEDAVLTPLENAVEENDPRVLADNVPKGGISFEEFILKSNMVYELKVAPKLGVITFSRKIVGESWDQKG